MLQRPFSAAVRVNASFWLLVLLAAIVSPLTVVAAILTAAALHELGHLAAMRYYGVSSVSALQRSARSWTLPPSRGSPMGAS